SMETLYAHLDAVASAKQREKLETFKDQAWLSRRLVEIHTDAPVEFDAEQFRTTAPDAADLGVLFKELEFSQLQKMFPVETDRKQKRYHTVATPEGLRDLAEAMERQAGSQSFWRSRGTLPQRLLERQDLRLARRWLPVLRYYVAAGMDEWDDAIIQQAKRDFQQSRRDGIPERLLATLRLVWRFSEARQSGLPERLVSVAETWTQLQSPLPFLRIGTAYLLETILSLEQAERMDDALIWLVRGLRLYPLSYELLLTQARITRRVGRFDLSLAACEQLIEHFSDDGAGYALRSNLNFLKGDYAAAAHDAERAIKVAPQQAGSFMARAFVHLQLGDYQAALTDFDQVLQRDPQRFDAQRGRARCLSMLGRDNAAMTAFQSLLRRYPEDIELYYEMADLLFAAGYLHDCERICRRGLAIDDQAAALWVIYGMAANRLGREDQAQHRLSRALELDPENPFALNELSWILHLQGEDEASIDLVDRALTLSPDYVDAICNKGVIHYHRSEFNEAEETFAQAIGLWPDYVPAWVGKGNALTQLCEFDDALLCYDEALKLDPRNAEACQGKALLYRMIGLDDDMRKWQEMAHRLDPNIDDDFNE
ncbi:MAG: tetratricopeptide repeat protein, partial [Clostridia bacterium]|nr:tetratricopeptide repeat protein [Clostridia bacterium]